MAFKCLTKIFFPEENTTAVENTEVNPYFTTENLRRTTEIFSRRVNYLARDLSSSKDKAELLASRLQEKCLLRKDFCIIHFCIIHFRKRNKDLVSCFSVGGQLCINNKSDELYHCLFQEHVPAVGKLLPLP